MKRVFSLFFVLALCLGLCACTVSNNTTPTAEINLTEATNATKFTDPTTEPSTEPATEPTTEPTTAPTTEPATEPATAPTTEPPHTHSFSIATCTTPSTCSCGATEGRALGHTWTDATCTAPKTCSKCGTTDGSAAGHNWKNTTCTAPKTCSTCGTTEGSAAGHNWKNATCTAPKSCSTCGATEGSAAGHNWKDATCTAPKTCSVCNVTEGSTVGHNWKEATCSMPEHCTICNTYVGWPLDHNWEKVSCTEQKCVLCGDHREALSHLWGEDYICSDCDRPYCDLSGHYFSYNRCYICSTFDEESMTLAQRILGTIISQNMTEYEKVKAIHDYIVNTTQYDYEHYLNGTIPDVSYSPLGVLTYGKAVCQGYTYSFELLCDLSGIDCESVRGTADNGTSVGGHAWNQVKVNGKWYNIDVCWDDPLYTFNGVTKEILRYDYFLISDSMMYIDHTAENAKHICNESYQ